MYTYQLKHPLEKDGIEFVDIVEPTGGSPEFNKACAALAGQFIYSQGKFSESPIGKKHREDNEEKLKAKAEEVKAKKEKSENGEELQENPEDEVDYFESAKAVNMLYSAADKEYLVNITSKFADVYKKSPKILRVGSGPDDYMKQLQFNSLSWYDLSVLATAYCLAFMQG